MVQLLAQAHVWSCWKAALAAPWHTRLKGAPWSAALHDTHPAVPVVPPAPTPVVTPTLTLKSVFVSPPVPQAVPNPLSEASVTG
jgi:hypothetical protein